MIRLNQQIKLKFVFQNFYYQSHSSFRCYSTIYKNGLLMKKLNRTILSLYIFNQTKIIIFKPLDKTTCAILKWKNVFQINDNISIFPLKNDLPRSHFILLTLLKRLVL